MYKINFNALLNDSKSVSLSTKRNLGKYIRLGEEFNDYIEEITDIETADRIGNKCYDVETVMRIYNKCYDIETAERMIGNCHQFYYLYEVLKNDVEHNQILSPSGKILWEKYNEMQSILYNKFCE